MNFKKFYIEAIDFNSKEVIVVKGEVLYHGTIESFDSRKARTSAYDDVFWTTDDIKIARTYIPAKSSYMNTSLSSILKDKDHEGIRKSLGITPQIIKYAFLKQEESYKKLRYWEKQYQDFANKYKEYEKTRFDDLTDDFFSQWSEAESNYKKAEKEMKWHDHYLKVFVIHKMKAFGYEPNGYSNDYFKKIMTDNEGNLLPMSNRSVGKVLKVICNRDFKFYNMAYGKEGDLMDVDYHKVELFRKMEEKGYDGIIINDFAQSEYHGNYGHLSVGFFKSAMKDLTVKQIRNQTHPTEKDWKETIDHNSITANDLIYWVRKNHRNPSDIWEGDLEDRITNYSIYKLVDLPLSAIDTDEWESDDDTVKDYQDKYTSTKNYPPIIYDLKDKSIIDGTHRARALKNIGVKTIKAYVGVS